MSTAIQVEGLSKAFRVKGLGAPTLFGSLQRALSGRKPDLFWALKDVSFSVPAGRTVGVIGPNGSGKSSLLGLIAGTLTPTHGRVRTQGRISSLLELGAGFHPDLTGRENVYLNAAILGIPREDIRRRFDALVDFSGLRDFIDQPVKHYSSGMYVRLGFAVAVEMNPDILLIDEVLAVGDIAFQLKCLDRIRDFQRRGKTLLMVSHALQTVEDFCDEALLIHQGQRVAQGPPPDTIMTYIRSYMGEGGHLLTQEFGTREAEFTSVRLLDADGNESAVFDYGQPMTVELQYRAHTPIERPVFGCSIKTGNGFYLFGTNTQIERTTIERIEGEGCMCLRFDPLQLISGNFFLSVSLHSWDHAEQYHRREDWYPFAVRNETDTQGVTALPVRFEIDPDSASRMNSSEKD